MMKFNVGDKVRIIHNGKQVETTVIFEILEDYGGFSYWLQRSNGRLMLEIETPETVFEKIEPKEIAKVAKDLTQGNLNKNILLS
jgi:hypothetical protein